MIEFVNGNPADEEIAAVVAAFSHTVIPSASTPHPSDATLTMNEVEGRRASAWTMAMRNPDLEIEDLRRVR